MVLPKTRKLSLLATFHLMARTFPSEPMQLAWGIWSIVWGFIILLPYGEAIGGSDTLYGWMSILPCWVWGTVWIAKGLPHVWGALRVLQVRLDPEAPPCEADTAYLTCAVTALLDLTASAFMSVAFLLTKGPLNPIWAWYAFYAVTCFWIFSRIVADRRG